MDVRRARSMKLHAVAAVLAALWTLVPAATAVHGALEAHAYCVEHGAFEEAASHAASPADDDTAARLRSTPGPDADGHAACAFARAVLRDARPEVAPACAAGPAPAALPLILPAWRPFVARAVPLLAVAPKSSPPSVG